MVSGSLPPGLQLGAVCGNVISGTPTQAGTYPFTVQVTSIGNDETGVTEPSSTQQLTITIGTGSSDRLANVAAGKYNLHIHDLSVGGYDANAGALYSLSLTSTGKQLVAPESMAGHGGAVSLYSSDPSCTDCTETIRARAAPGDRDPGPHASLRATLQRDPAHQARRGLGTSRLDMPLFSTWAARSSRRNR